MTGASVIIHSFECIEGPEKKGKETVTLEKIILQFIVPREKSKQLIKSYVSSFMTSRCYLGEKGRKGHHLIRSNSTML